MIIHCYTFFMTFEFKATHSANGTRAVSVGEKVSMTAMFARIRRPQGGLCVSGRVRGCGPDTDTGRAPGAGQAR